MREYKPCKICGSTRVDRAVVNTINDPDKEWVIVTCAGCENRRNGYARKKTTRRRDGVAT